MNTFNKIFIFCSLCKIVYGIVTPDNSTSSTETSKSYKTDSYLEAYSKSRVEAEKSKNVFIVTAGDKDKKAITNRGDFGGYDYTPSNNYGPPSPVYNNFDNSYPQNGYGSPSYDNYGGNQNFGNNPYPPARLPMSYGPPSYGPTAPIYGPPVIPYKPSPEYGIPYASTGILAALLKKISFKLDIITIAKILLKLLIFKKIVKMIAVICLLLFIPKLIHWKKKHHEQDDFNNDDENEDDEGFRSIKLGDNRQVREIVSRAFKVYGKATECNGVSCRLMKVLDDIDEHYPFIRIAESVYAEVMQ